MAHLETGPASGATVILVQGLTDSSRSWSTTMQALHALDPGLGILAVDQHGHGASRMPPAETCAPAPERCFRIQGRTSFGGFCRLYGRAKPGRSHQADTEASCRNDALPDLEQQSTSRKTVALNHHKLREKLFAVQISLAHHTPGIKRGAGSTLTASSADCPS